MRKMSIRLNIDVYKWAEEYGTTISEYAEHAIYSAEEFGEYPLAYVKPRRGLKPKYDTSIYLTDKSYKLINKIAIRNDISKSYIINYVCDMFHVKHYKHCKGGEPLE